MILVVSHARFSLLLQRNGSEVYKIKWGEALL